MVLHFDFGNKIFCFKNSPNAPCGEFLFCNKTGSQPAVQSGIQNFPGGES